MSVASRMIDSQLEQVMVNVKPALLHLNTPVTGENSMLSLLPSLPLLTVIDTDEQTGVLVVGT